MNDKEGEGRAKVTHGCLSNPVCGQCLGAIWEEQAFPSKAVVDPEGATPRGCQLTEFSSQLKWQVLS